MRKRKHLNENNSVRLVRIVNRVRKPIQCRPARIGATTYHCAIVSIVPHDGRKNLPASLQGKNGAGSGRPTQRLHTQMMEVSRETDCRSRTLAGLCHCASQGNRARTCTCRDRKQAGSPLLRWPPCRHCGASSLAGAAPQHPCEPAPQQTACCEVVACCSCHGLGWSGVKGESLMMTRESDTWMPPPFPEVMLRAPCDISTDAWPPVCSWAKASILSKSCPSVRSAALWKTSSLTSPPAPSSAELRKRSCR